MRVSRLTKDKVLMRLVKDRETYEGENKGRKEMSENIAYAFCHCEPLDEAKQSLIPLTCHCEGLDVPKQSLSKTYEKVTTRSLHKIYKLILKTLHFTNRINNYNFCFLKM